MSALVARRSRTNRSSGRRSRKLAVPVARSPVTWRDAPGLSAPSKRAVSTISRDSCPQRTCSLRDSEWADCASTDESAGLPFSSLRSACASRREQPPPSLPPTSGATGTRSPRSGPPRTRRPSAHHERRFHDRSNRRVRRRGRWLELYPGRPDLGRHCHDDHQQRHLSVEHDGDDRRHRALVAPLRHLLGHQP
jgi:hypothetical protein